MVNPSSDILVIGGGAIGLAIAIEARRRGASVTLLTRNYQEAATLASAGTLAPQAEEIPPGALLDLALESRAMYPEWIASIEQRSGSDTGYFPNGIIAPVSQVPNAAPVTGDRAPATWLDAEQLSLYQPGLGAEIVGGWWYPEDGYIDSRTLYQALRKVAQAIGVRVQTSVKVKALVQHGRSVAGIRTSSGLFQARQYVLASGAWARELLPLPVEPLKGQMLALQIPHAKERPFPIERVIFGSDVYLVPRQDGRLLVGATVEEAGWQGGNTPQGVQKLLAGAMHLYPGLSQWTLEELWWGFRPTTPDRLPILGASECENLLLATGHFRYGIVLAPVTAMTIVDLLEGKPAPDLLEAFHYDRFNQRDRRQISPAPAPESLYSLAEPGGAIVQAIGDITEYEDSPSDEKPMTDSNGRRALPSPEETPTRVEPLVIAGRQFRSRLMTGTGKYPSLEVMQQSIVESGCEIVTVAVRRIQTKAPGHEGLAQALDWGTLWMLPNTAGCKTAEEAIRVARLGREMAKLLGQEDNNFVKLEVIPDQKYLLPDPMGTLRAAEKLVNEGFAVLPYINADPVLAKHLEEVGCVTVMPLGSPIGSGQGLQNAANIRIIVEEANIPVVVDAGIGTPSEAVAAMEMGADALLINSAIALSKNPVIMARAMGMATEVGYLARKAGRIPIKDYGSASSPVTGLVGSDTEPANQPATY